MAKKYVSSDDFGKAMVDLLNEYEDEIYDDVQQTTKDLGSQALMAVKAASPKNTGAYAAGWSKNNVNNKRAGYYYVRIRNKERYSLTHLLNFGHNFKSYGKVWGKYRGDNHITRTELEFKKKFTVELKHKIER